MTISKTVVHQPYQSVAEAAQSLIDEKCEQVIILAKPPNVEGHTRIKVCCIAEDAEFVIAAAQSAMKLFVQLGVIEESD